MQGLSPASRTNLLIRDVILGFAALHPRLYAVTRSARLRNRGIGTSHHGRVLLRPQLVRRSRSDDAVKLFYEYYAQASVDGKWLCVVVKYDETDAFVVTAYLTDKPKAGEDLWPRK